MVGWYRDCLVVFCFAYLSSQVIVKLVHSFAFASTHFFRFRATSITSFIHPALLTLDPLKFDLSFLMQVLDLWFILIYAKKEGWWFMRDNHIYSSSLLHILRSSCEIARLYLWHIIWVSYTVVWGIALCFCFGMFRTIPCHFGLLWAHLGSRVQIWGSKCAKSGQRMAKEWPKSGLWGVEARSHEPKPGQLKRDDDAHNASHLSPTPWKGIDLYPLHIASGAIQLATEQLPIWVRIGSPPSSDFSGLSADSIQKQRSGRLLESCLSSVEL